MRLLKWLKYFLVILVIVLIGLRLYLPYFLKDYVEAKLNKLPDYHAKIDSITVHLIVGSYVINHLQLWKVNHNIPVPFFASPAIRLSVQWRALLHGRFVGAITVDSPQVNFVDDPAGKNEQLSIDKEWLTIVKSLFPLNINQVNINNGQVHFRSYSGKPPFDIYLKKLDANVTNMQNVSKDPSNLSSSFKVTANTMDDGQINVSGKFNPFNDTPTFNIAMQLNGLHVDVLSSFLMHYTHVSAERGEFSLYCEMVAAKGHISGYAKPFIKNLKIRMNAKNPIEALYQGAVAVTAHILKNSEQKTVATKIKLSGDINDPNVSVWSIIGYLLRHAFIETLIPSLDHDVKMQDVVYPASNK